MIQRLRRRFILVATAATLLLMLALVGIMNFINYRSVVAEADAVLELLDSATAFGGPGGHAHREPHALFPRELSPESPYEARYFTVTFSPEGEVLELDISRIGAVNGEEALDYVQRVLRAAHDRGFVDRFRYVRTVDTARRIRLRFLDCGQRLSAYRFFLWTSFSVGLLGCFGVFCFFWFAADRLLRPIAESYEKQRQFITDAGHEIKTPLTILSANLDLLEADLGETEDITDMRAQLRRLTGLTQELVTLSKMEEPGRSLPRVAFPLSELTAEAAQPFAALAQTQHKDYRVEVTPGLTMVGAPDAIRQLFSLLLDNAMKYSPAGGMVVLTLTARKRTALLTLRNTTRDPVSPEELSKVFDRFTRLDASRSGETGGHGIGLSIAKAIVEAHGGKISASTTDGSDFCIAVTLPLGGGLN